MLVTLMIVTKVIIVEMVLFVNVINVWRIILQIKIIINNNV